MLQVFQFTVVDKWGYLWSGGGTYIKDFGGAIGRKHMLIRFNTEDVSMGLKYFPVDHETNVSGCARSCFCPTEVLRAAVVTA